MLLLRMVLPTTLLAVPVTLNRAEADVSLVHAAAAACSHTYTAPPPGTGYRLKAFISHMGSSAQTGHYICHIKKDGRWVIFNDRKVAASKRPPRELAYLYLYETV